MPIKPTRPAILLVIVSLLLPMPWSCGQSTEAKYHAAEEALEQGNSQAARRIYTDMLARQPVLPGAIEGMIHVTQIESATAEHVHWCEELIRYRPWDRHANLVVGQHLVEEGNLKDAVVRFILAYQNSEFKDEKKEALDGLNRVKEQLAAPSVQPASKDESNP